MKVKEFCHFEDIAYEGISAVTFVVYKGFLYLT